MLSRLIYSTSLWYFISKIYSENRKISIPYFHLNPLDHNLVSFQGDTFCNMTFLNAKRLLSSTKVQIWFFFTCLHTTKKNPSKKYHSFENTLFQHYTSAYIIEGQVYHFRYLHNTHIKCKNVSLIFNIETLDADDKKREEKKKQNQNSSWNVETREWCYNTKIKRLDV